MIPLPEAQMTAWRARVERAITQRKHYEAWWEANLRDYAPRPTESPDIYGETVNTNRHFALVEQKKPQLFYQSPEVLLKPSPLLAGQEPLVKLDETILNEKLGPDGVNARRLVQALIFDCLCPAGMGISKMGYEAVTQPVETTEQVGEIPQEGSILGLQTVPDFQPVTVEVPIYQRCFWERVSPKKFLIPDDYHATEFDKAPWLGMQFVLPRRIAQTRWKITENIGKSTRDEQVFDYGLPTAHAEDLVSGVIIEYRAAVYDDAATHPEQIRELVLLDGLDAPAEHRDSPYKTIGPDGTLTPDSVPGYTFHVLNLRDLADSAYVPSDCTIQRPLVNELNKFREQMVQMRDTNPPIRYFYTGGVSTETRDKIINGTIGTWIPTEQPLNDGTIGEIARAQYPRENLDFQAALDSDLARTMAVDANQGGQLNDTSRTATELQIVQGASNVRLDGERQRVVEWYLSGVQKYAALEHRFLTEQDAAKIVGPEAAQAWSQWVKTIPVALAWTALPDSTLRLDAAVERKRAQDEYSFLANDPNVNRQELLKQVLRRMNYNAEAILTQPPPQQPEPPRPSFSFKGEDLNPTAAQFPIVMAILQQGGFQIPPEAVQQAQQVAALQIQMQQTVAAMTPQDGDSQTEHPGRVAPVESLSKHQSDQTGGMPGVGIQ